MTQLQSLQVLSLKMVCFLQSLSDEERATFSLWLRGSEGLGPSHICGILANLSDAAHKTSLKTTSLASTLETLTTLMRSNLSSKKTSDERISVGPKESELFLNLQNFDGSKPSVTGY